MPYFGRSAQWRCRFYSFGNNITCRIGYNTMIEKEKILYFCGCHSRRTIGLSWKRHAYITSVNTLVCGDLAPLMLHTQTSSLLFKSSLRISLRIFHIFPFFSPPKRNYRLDERVHACARTFSIHRRANIFICIFEKLLMQIKTRIYLPNEETVFDLLFIDIVK